MKHTYIVMGSADNADYTNTWLVRAFLSEENANACVARLTAWCEENNLGVSDANVSARKAKTEAEEAVREAWLAAWWETHGGVPGSDWAPENAAAWDKAYKAYYDELDAKPVKEEEVIPQPPDDPCFVSAFDGTRYEVTKIELAE